MQQRLFSIDISEPFLNRLIKSILNGEIFPEVNFARDPYSIARLNLFLPSRRARRAFIEEMLVHLQGSATLLPKVFAIGDVAEDESLLVHIPHAQNVGESAAPLPPMEEGERLMTLAHLINHWAKSLDQAGSKPSGSAQTISIRFHQSLKMAQELMDLQDHMDNQELGWDKLDRLVPSDYAQHWQLTYEFLNILSRHWPEILKAKQRTSAILHRNQMMLLQFGRLLSQKPQIPVLVAGSTASMPITRKIMAMTLNSPHGAVVLPGLDIFLEEEYFDQLSLFTGPEEVSHPQFGMAKLLSELKFRRDQVQILSDHQTRSKHRSWGQCVSEIMRPVTCTDHWIGAPNRIGQQALADFCQKITVLRSKDEHEQAETIALVMREVLEHPHRTVTLITSDRAVARRVSAELLRYDIEVDDSAGFMLSQSPQGILSLLLSETISTSFEPLTLLQLLYHPLCQLGWLPGQARVAARILEIGVIRGQPPVSSISGLKAVLTRHYAMMKNGLIREPSLKVFEEEDWQLVQKLLDTLEQITLPLSCLWQNSEILPSFTRVMNAFVEALKAINASDEQLSGNDETLMALTSMLKSMADQVSPAQTLALSELTPVIKTLLDRENLHPVTKHHNRLRILGPLEARLQSFDRVILGNMIENSWPTLPGLDPWLNRSMRDGLGLEPPERRLVLTAHDLAQTFSANEIFFTEPQRVAGAPTVTSRYLQRMSVVMGENNWQEMTNRGEHWLELNRLRQRQRPEDRPLVQSLLERPAPQMGGKKLDRISVTDIALWQRDPYSIYARYFLNLQPLPDLFMQNTGALRGTLCHSLCASLLPELIESDVERETLRKRLLVIVDDLLEPYAYLGSLAAQWRIFLIDAGNWLTEDTAKIRSNISKILTEQKGQVELNLDSGRKFMVSGRADRIDFTSDGIIIIDYKTGGAPSYKDILNGAEPQLPIEAGMALLEGFGENVTGIRDLIHIEFKGGGNTSRRRSLLEHKKNFDMDALAKQTMESLSEFISVFDQPDASFPARRHQKFIYKYLDYAHLSRDQQWSLFDRMSGVDDG